MDIIDDQQVHLQALSDLSLSSEDEALPQRLASRLSGKTCQFLVLDRGLSSATKVVLKPKTLFPLLVKLDDLAAIALEAQGDALLRNRMPPLSIPPLEGVERGETRGAIAYRYVTGGRVRHVVRRFDTALLQLNTYRALQIIDDVFDVILKKCHWLDGQYEMRPVELPELQSTDANDPDSRTLLERYERARRACRAIRAPHAIVHGDLHAKNILVTRDDAPVLLDFSRARSGVCHFLDYATFEAPLQFQVDGSLAEKFWQNEGLQYGTTPLIIPHSNSKLAACIHRIRSNLWQGCTRHAVAMEPRVIDLVYRGFLIGCLIRLYLRKNNSTETRMRAYRQAVRLSDVFHSSATIEFRII